MVFPLINFLTSTASPTITIRPDTNQKTGIPGQLSAKDILTISIDPTIQQSSNPAIHHPCNLALQQSIIPAIQQSSNPSPLQSCIPEIHTIWTFRTSTLVKSIVREDFKL
jgi:hypothetical protein